MSAPVQPDNRRGILLMVLMTFVFSLQDGISRHLAGEYNTMMIVMIRYWFLASFVVALALRSPGGIRGTARSGAPLVQVARSLLLAAEICLTVLAFVLLGLVETHAVFAVYPLIVTALAGPVLGERAGWRRWTAVGVGFLGILVILRPGAGVMDPVAVVPLVAAAMFALYNLLTRYAGRIDTAATSFFWTGTLGAVAMTLAGVWFWEPMRGPDWVWMGILCLSGAFGHWLLIKVYEAAEASAVQPFAYLQLVFASAMGMVVFGESPEAAVFAGMAIVVAAGLFTFSRARKVGQG